MYELPQTIGAGMSKPDITVVHLVFPNGITTHQAQDIAMNAEAYAEAGVSQGGFVLLSGVLGETETTWSDNEMEFIYSYDRRTAPPKLGTKKEDKIWSLFHKDMPLRIKREDLALIGKDFYMYKAGFLRGEDHKEKEMSCSIKPTNHLKPKEDEPPKGLAEGLSPRALEWLKSLAPWMSK